MAETKKLTRSKTERMLGGVCGGLGAYFDIDPVIFRLLFVFLSVFIGGGLLAYVILWIVVPEEDGVTMVDMPPSEPAPDTGEEAEPADAE